MNKGIGILPIAGWIVGIAIVVYNASQYGKRWEFNWYGCPAPLVSQDGLHWGDGTKIDSLDLAEIRNGPGPAKWLAVYAVGILAIVYILYVRRLMKRSDREHAEEMRYLKELNARVQSSSSSTHSV